MSYFGVAVSKLLTQIKKSSGAERLDLLDQLYQRTANHLQGIAILYLTDKSHIEDTVEETFVRVIRYIDRFNEASDGYNWMCKITENAAHDINKLYYREDVGIPDNFYDESSRFNVQVYLEDSEERNAVKEAVKHLSPEMQDLYYLEYVCNLSRSDIARLKNVSKSTISKRCARLEALVLEELKKFDD